MTATYSTVSGCCAARYWYDIGYVHGRQRAKDIGEFATWFDGKLATINFCVTNSAQKMERGWLEELGWHAAPQMGTDLIVHSISASHFRQVNTDLLHKIRQAKLEEEKKKREKELARRKALEELRAKESGNFNLQDKKDRFEYIKRIRKITPDDIRFFSPPELNITGGWSSLLKLRHKVVYSILDNLDIDHGVWDGYINRGWTDRRTRSALCERINARLRKQK